LPPLQVFTLLSHGALSLFSRELRKSFFDFPLTLKFINEINVMRQLCKIELKHHVTQTEVEEAITGNSHFKK
jgi:hypothetical protein